MDAKNVMEFLQKINHACKEFYKGIEIDLKEEDENLEVMYMGFQFCNDDKTISILYMTHHVNDNDVSNENVYVTVEFLVDFFKL